MNKEIKIGMVLDDYKLSNKEFWWKKCLALRPEIERDYEFDREEIGAGLTPNTTNIYRYYRLKTK
jgi:hypothetical protein